MENNYYYEPTIKTSRKEDEDSVYSIKFYTLNRQIEQLQNEKQQLISFLEEKIKENVDRREELAKNIGYGDEYDFGLNILKITNKLQAYREVLDFINKGGKDE